MDNDTPGSPLFPLLFLIAVAFAVVGNLIVWATTDMTPLDTITVWFNVIADPIRTAWNFLLGILPW